MDLSNWSHLGLRSLPVWQHRGADARVLRDTFLSSTPSVNLCLEASLPAAASGLDANPFFKKAFKKGEKAIKLSTRVQAGVLQFAGAATDARFGPSPTSPQCFRW